MITYTAIYYVGFYSRNFSPKTCNHQGYSGVFTDRIRIVSFHIVIVRSRALREGSNRIGKRRIALGKEYHGERDARFDFEMSLVRAGRTIMWVE